MATRIEDSVQVSNFYARIEAMDSTIVCEPYRRALADSDASWTIWCIMRCMRLRFQNQTWLRKRTFHNFQIRHVGTEIAQLKLMILCDQQKSGARNWGYGSARW